MCVCVCVWQDFHLNRVSMEEGLGAESSPAGARPKKKNRKTYDLTAVDAFWQRHKGRWVTCVCVCVRDGESQVHSSTEACDWSGVD